jgi:hypothetical protein
MTDDQIAQVEKLAWKHARVKWSNPPGFQFDDAELIQFVRALRTEALEEAAKVAENWKQDTGGQDVYLWPPTHIAAAIRALIGPQNEKSAPQP